MSDASTREWLEADGLGGFASGTAAGIRTRRYHALLLTARTPADRARRPRQRLRRVRRDGGRALRDLVAGVRARRDVTGRRRRGSSAFEHEPWPRWIFALPDGTRDRAGDLRAEGLFGGRAVVEASRGRRSDHARGAAVSLRAATTTRCTTRTPRFASRRGRDARAAACASSPTTTLPAVRVRSNGAVLPAHDWYRTFVYARGEGARARLLRGPRVARGRSASISRGEAVWLAAAEGPRRCSAREAPRRRSSRCALSERSRRRAGFADRARPRRPMRTSYGAARAGPSSPAIRGSPTGGATRSSRCGACAWRPGGSPRPRGSSSSGRGAVSEGMLPNFFPDAGAQPEFNSVDASLWYVVAVYEYFEAMAAAGRQGVAGTRRHGSRTAVEAILAGYATGTRFGIRADSDGLLAAGQPGVQLTWMDAKVGDWVVTPRIGKPVEVQALWLNALWIATRVLGSLAGAPRPRPRVLSRAFLERGGRLALRRGRSRPRARRRPTRRSGRTRSSRSAGCRFPIARGRAGPADRGRGRGAARDAARTALARAGRSGYVGRYEGGPRAARWRVPPGNRLALSRRRVRGRLGAGAWRHRRRQGGGARGASSTPLRAHLAEAGLGHVSEIADGDAPHTPRGCPFQAWSLGELLRIDRVILAD